MTEAIFQFLSKIGFSHPLHPAFVHIPMGMAVGAFIFRLFSLIPKLKGLAKTGYHCVILGLVGIFPAAFAGYLDWQHRLNGTWEFLIIIKMILAALLAIVFAAIVIRDDPENPGFNRVLFFYLAMILLAVGVGFSGGQLIYG